MRRNRRSSKRDGNTLSRKLKSMGAIADFDPAYGASDDGTTSTWTDRIGGYTVASTSQATRLVYSSSLSGLNGLPGWTGSTANQTKLVQTSSALAAALDGNAPFTAYYARKRTGTGAVWSVGKATGSGDFHACVVSSTASGTSGFQRYDGGFESLEGSVGGTDLRVDTVIYDGDSAASWTNAAVSFADSAATINVVDATTFGVGVRIGGSGDLWFDGLIGRIVIFGEAHSDAVRTHVQWMLMHAYGLA